MIGLPAMMLPEGVDDANGQTRIHMETTVSSAGCPRSGMVAEMKDRPRVELVDLPMFGRPVRLIWRERRSASLGLRGPWRGLSHSSRVRRFADPPATRMNLGLVARQGAATG